MKFTHDAEIFWYFFLNSFVLFGFMWQFNQSNYKLQLKNCKLYTWCCKFSGMLKWNVLLPSGCWHIEKQGGVRQVHIWNPFLRTRSQEEKTTTARHIVPVAMITSCSWTHLRANDTISKKEVTDSGKLCHETDYLKWFASWHSYRKLVQ